MFEIVQIMFMVAIASYLLITSPSAKDVARIIAGVAAIAWAIILIVPGI